MVRKRVKIVVEACKVCTFCSVIKKSQLLWKLFVKTSVNEYAAYVDISQISHADFTNIEAVLDYSYQLDLTDNGQDMISYFSG